MVVMEPIIHLKAENVRIMIHSEKEITEKHDISTRGGIIKCIKGIYRYDEFSMPKDIMLRILWLAHKGESCKEDHLDATQRMSLYEYLKDREITDPYINQFIKESKEKLLYADV